MSIRFASAVLLAGVLQGCASGGGSAPGHDAQTPEIVPHDVRQAFDRAVHAMREARWDDAETLLVAITRSTPELPGPWVNLAAVYRTAGRTERAEQALTRALQADPDHCAARTELGVLARRRGGLEEAEAHYHACLAADPEYAPARLNLGILYDLYLGRPADALEAYRRYQALRVEPDARVALWVIDLERRTGV